MFHQILSLVRHCYFGLADVLWLLFFWRAAIILRRSPDEKWRRHLDWVKMILVGCATDVIYRTVENVRYFFGIKMGDSIFDPIGVIEIVGAVFSLIGVYRFYRLLRRDVPAPSLLDRNVEDWPQTNHQADHSESSAANSNIERNAW